MISNEITFIDLFSGIGGFRLGLERVGMRCVWSCDNDRCANAVYTRHFGAENHYAGDVREVDAGTIPDHDILCAGFPCQSFSYAGERKGFDDVRGTLFFEIYRIAKHKRPAILLLENVRGLLSNDKGKTFGVILESLSQLGYLLEWKVLNSKHFGVPQNRQRVFVVGHLRGTGGREIFPITGKSSKNIKIADGEVEKVTTLQTAHLHSSRWGDWIKEQIHSDTLDSTGSLGVMMLGDNWGGNIRERIRSVDKNPAWCLGGSQTIITNGIRGRLFTPKECERLQGFPDGWTDGVKDSKRRMLLGNAVTVNVVEFLGRLILERCGL